MNFHVLTYMNSLRRIYSIKLSKERSRTIWWHGLKIYSYTFMAIIEQRSTKFLTISTTGEFFARCRSKKLDINNQWFLY